MDTAPGKNDHQLFRKCIGSYIEYILNTSTMRCEQHFSTGKAYLVEELVAASSLSPPSNRNITNSVKYSYWDRLPMQTHFVLKSIFISPFLKTELESLCFIPFIKVIISVTLSGRSGQLMLTQMLLWLRPRSRCP